MKVYIETVRDGVEIPKYAHNGDAGMDVRAAADVMIHPGETVIIPTGLKLAVPEGFELQVRARSGISLRTPLRLANGVGTVDSGYRGEIGVIITNTVSADISDNELHTLENPGKGIYLIRKGDRIAQFVLARYELIEFESCGDVSESGTDRGGGLGSTGVK